MSRNAIAAMAVIFVSGFAGCAATARADDAAASQAPAAIHTQAAPVAHVTHTVVAVTATAEVYVSADVRRSKRDAPPA